MRNHVNINGPELVHGTNELRLFVRSQVSQVQNPQFSKSEEHSERTRILALIRRTLLRSVATRILASAPIERLFNEFAIRTNHTCFNALYRQRIARLGNNAR